MVRRQEESLVQELAEFNEVKSIVTTARDHVLSQIDQVNFVWMNSPVHITLVIVNSMEFKIKNEHGHGLIYRQNLTATIFTVASVQ